MPNVGPLELAIVLIIALIVFGPKRLPELGRSLGRGIREFRGSVSGDHDDDDDSKPRGEIEPSQPPAPAEDGEDETVAHDRH
jgi:sec-independent protein translocase protein TatA